MTIGCRPDQVSTASSSLRSEAERSNALEQEAAALRAALEASKRDNHKLSRELSRVLGTEVDFFQSSVADPDRSAPPPPHLPLASDSHPHPLSPPFLIVPWPRPRTLP